ncbi:unnamed protein product [Rangifer tarandus platyrhynchus]|uniref:Uncharacterized protein n=3 Tax=Rangifer tarandus platyrhynchus TaxID=3082113 RepID=A0ACB0E923_RANTA|nr:unnamed protein product [Rangifer tarandus platyrhynchus]CAI9697070.1 unnamed protein product [Rangifer tarandus platyrhynchus]
MRVTGEESLETAVRGGLSEEVAFVQNGTVLESEVGYGGKPGGNEIRQQSPWMLFLNESMFMPQQEAGSSKCDMQMAVKQSSPDQYKVDPGVLSYTDSLLQQSDVSLLDPPSWLNDHAIGFVFEYFANSQFHDCSDHVCFISPEVTQFIECTGNPAEIAMFPEPLNLPNKRVIYLAINSNLTAGGAHWSLLVYLQDKNGFFHYDSYSSSNSFHTKQVAEKLEAFLGRKGNKLAVVEEKAPSQQSSYDFGMYMICNTEALCQNFSRPQPESLRRLLTLTHIRKKREEWKDLTARLAKN